MGINRVSTYLPFTLGVLLRRAASTTPMYRADAVTPCRNVRTRLVSSFSFVLRSSLLFPRFPFFFFRRRRRRRLNRDIPWRNNIADHVFSGRNASPRPQYRCAAFTLRRVVEHRRFLPSTRRMLNERVPVRVFGYVAFSWQLETSHGSIRYDGEEYLGL